MAKNKNKEVSKMVEAENNADSTVEVAVSEPIVVEAEKKEEPVAEEKQPVVEEKQPNIVLTKQESTSLANYLRLGMSFVDARKKILDARGPVKYVDVNSPEALKEAAVKEVKLGKTDAERKLLLINELARGTKMDKAMIKAYGEGCKNINGKIFTKEQLLLLTQ